MAQSKEEIKRELARRAKLLLAGEPVDDEDDDHGHHSDYRHDRRDYRESVSTKDKEAIKEELKRRAKLIKEGKSVTVTEASDDRVVLDVLRGLEKSVVTAQEDSGESWKVKFSKKHGALFVTDDKGRNFKVTAEQIKTSVE